MESLDVMLLVSMIFVAIYHAAELSGAEKAKWHSRFWLVISVATVVAKWVGDYAR